ncbi:hypothetical protein [Allonocardiopsis opalescens]|nr:hypothetical protein [Allonocardiopsis opalescens]
MSLTTNLRLETKSNMVSLDQAVEAMRRGQVGQSILAKYTQLQDSAARMYRIAGASESELQRMKGVDDAYTAFPDAGDKKFLTAD